MGRASAMATDITFNNRLFVKRHFTTILLVCIALLYGGAVTILHDETASPVDELVYIDYTYKTFKQGMVFEGEKFGDEVAQFVGCEGVFPFGALGQSCDPGEANLSLMPNAGYTTGAPYTPVYFWVTRIVGDTIHWTTGINQVTSWRLTGSLWLAFSMVLFVGLFRRWKVDDRATLTLGLLFIASPFTWWTYTYLSTDITAFLFGTLMLFLATHVWEKPKLAWWFVPISFVGAVFKITNLIALGLVILYFLIQWISSIIRARKNLSIRRPCAKNVLTLAGALVSSAVIGTLVQVIWTRMLPILAVSQVKADQGVSRNLGGMDILALLTAGPGAAIAHNPVAGINGGQLLTAAAVPLTWFAVAAVFGALMAIRWNPTSGPFIWATALSTVLALPALGIAFNALMGSYFELPGRYVASLIPAVLLLGGFLLRNRFTSLLLMVYAGVLMLSGFVLAIFIRLMF